MSQPGKKQSTLLAGGGQSSAYLDHKIVKDFTPTVSKCLESIYKDLSGSHATPEPDGPPLTSFDQFQGWFQSPASAALAPPVNHDLTLPLCNYFISSSHNTYLSGNQLYGIATTDAYKNVLLRGCRCLEIDVWNGEDEASSVSSSDVEAAGGEQKASTRKRALSKLKGIKGRASNKLHGQSTSPKGDRSSANAPAQDDVDDLAEKPSPIEIAERRAALATEPRVYHGYTLTKAVPFREVCRAICSSAFKASTLPVIVSLEVHCNLDQQQVMVDIMKETWDGHLVDMTNKSYEDIPQLPSPDALRNKILIKVKWTHSADSQTNNPLEISQSNTSAQTDGSALSQQASQQKKASKVLDSLSKLGVYTRAYSFKNFGQPEAKIPTHVFSLDENKLGQIHSHPEHGPDMFSHNRNFLVRIYPSGLRVNSSNIDPAFSWRQGAQMVALNWQSLDKGMMLNEGMFAGEDGYVLKPDGFRSNSISNQTHPTRRRLNLTIQLLAGQHLPLPAEKEPSHADHLKPYVQIQLHVDTHGPPGQGKNDFSDSTTNLASKYDKESAGEDRDEDEQKLKRRSRTSRTNNPDYGHTELAWKDIPDVVEQLSFLRVKVKDDRTMARDDLAAWACIRLDRLKTGYRFIHLLDTDGAPSEGVLLVKIEKEIY